MLAPLLILGLTLVACDGDGGPVPSQFPTDAGVKASTERGSVTPVPSPLPTDAEVKTSTKRGSVTPVPSPLPTDAEVKASAKRESVTSTPDYLEQAIPPCTPVEGSNLDPCEPNVPGIVQTNTELRLPSGEPESVRWFLGAGGAEGLFSAHLVVRGTYIPGSLRCSNLNEFRSPNTADLGNRSYDDGIGAVLCFVDMRVASYILGTGPSTLTLLIERQNFWAEASEGEVEELLNSYEQIFRNGGINDRVAVPDGGILGREVIDFIGPLHNTAVETWVALWTWDVQRRDEDNVTIAVHPFRDAYRDLSPSDYQTYKSKLEMDLPTFAQAVSSANSQRLAQYGGRVYQEEGVTYPVVLTDANNLRQHLTAVGGYSHPDGPPMQPPSVYAPAPATLTATGVGEEGANLSWAAVTGATGYQIQHRIRGGEKWRILADSVTGTTHAASGLWCDRVYEFRVGAYGDGTSYNVRTGVWSAVATATTTSCSAQAPRFFNTPFAFDVSVGAVQGDLVGTPSAIDLNGDPITFSITAGNTANKFSIDPATGEITVSERLRGSVRL